MTARASTGEHGDARRARLGAYAFTSVALGLAAATAWMCWRLLVAGGYANEPTQPVVVAARQIEAGHPLAADDLKLVSWPASSLLPGMFHATAGLLAPEPRVPTTGLLPGEPVVAARLASADAGPGLAALVGAETRAVAIKVDREVGAARLVYPGARVDVLATLQERERGPETRTIIADARVLAVGSFADVEAARRGLGEGGGASLGSVGDGDGAAVVTLEVKPADAERLTLAAREGKLDLALRNAGDRALVTTHGASTGELFAEDAPVAAAAAPAPRKRSRAKKEKEKVKVVYDEATAAAPPR